MYLLVYKCYTFDFQKYYNLTRLYTIMDKITSNKRVTVSGNSLIIKVTKELRFMELEEGDEVRVTLEKIN